MRGPSTWLVRPRLTELPGSQVGARGDQSRDVPSHHVGGKRAEAAPPEAPRCESHLRIPVYLDGTARLTRILWPIPTLPKRPLALVPAGTAWRAPGAFLGQGECRGCPDTLRWASGPGLLLGGLGRAILTLHADAPHLGAAGSVEGTGDPAAAVADQK